MSFRFLRQTHGKLREESDVSLRKIPPESDSVGMTTFLSSNFHLQTLFSMFYHPSSNSIPHIPQHPQIPHFLRKIKTDSKKLGSLKNPPRCKTTSGCSKNTFRQNLCDKTDRWEKSFP